MNDATHRELREPLGWYAIGRADESERVRVEAHLDGCPTCRAELAELRGTVGSLDLVDPGRIDENPSPRADLGDDVVRRVMAATPVNAHRHRKALLAVAAVLALVLAGGVGWVLRPEPATIAAVPTEPVQVQADIAALNASAKLIAHTWGVEIQLTATGFDAGKAFHVQMIDTQGERSSAGEFVGTGQNQMRCNLNSAVLRSNAAGFEVVDDAGSVLLTSQF